MQILWEIHLCNLIIVALLIVIAGMLIFRKNTKQMMEKGD